MMNDIFDLGNYPFNVNTGMSYFDLRVNGEQVVIYRGYPKNNDYGYFEFLIKGEDVKKWNEFYKKYFIDFEDPCNRDNEYKGLEKTQGEVVKEANGLDAYLKYWNDCISIEFKCYNPITTIYHFEAMKEWFELNLEYYIKTNENYFKVDELREAKTIKFRNDCLKEVETELQKQANAIESAKTITAFHAIELIKFYKYLQAELKESEQQETVNKAPQASIEFKPNIFLKEMPLETVNEHFKVFVTTKCKNGKPFLSVEQLNSFIERAFVGNSIIEKQTFNPGTREKLFIVKRFFEFYLLAVSSQYEIGSQCKDKYVKLITDNFTNWDYKDIKNNFGNKVKRAW